MRGANPSGRRRESLCDSPHPFPWGRGNPSPHPSPAALRAARSLGNPSHSSDAGRRGEGKPPLPGGAPRRQISALSPRREGNLPEGQAPRHRATRRKSTPAPCILRMRGANSLWWNPGERRERPVLPVGARRPADKAREGGAPTGRTGPGVFRPKRNDERRVATRFSRDGSPAEPPPGELGRVGFTTGCLGGMDRRSSPHRENWAAWVSPQAVNPTG